MDGSATGYESISQEEFLELKIVHETEGTEGYQSYLQKKNDAWRNIPVNIGIIGSSGVGKSSFINSIRDLEGDDTGAAPVGVTEQTTMPTVYAHPSNDLMQFWDLPGVGTPMFPKESYLTQIGFEKFDFFLVLTSVRFTENDEWLAREITNNRKNFFFLRTKIQNDLDNDRSAHPKVHKADPVAARERILDRIRSNLKDNLKELYADNRVFLIDNYKKYDFDFPLLERRLAEDFPELKRQALIFSMTACSEHIVRMKAEVLRSSLRTYASISAGIAAIPLPGLSITCDIGILLIRSKFFFDQFGLNDISLKRLANATGSDPERLQAIVNDMKVNQFLTAQGIKQVFTTLPAAVISKVVEQGLYLIPLLGSVAAGAISFAATYLVLQYVLNKMEDTALQVVRVAYQSLMEA